MERIEEPIETLRARLVEVLRTRNIVSRALGVSADRVVVHPIGGVEFKAIKADTEDAD